MSDNITLSGTVFRVLPEESFPSGFTKRVLVIEAGDKYPQHIPIEFVKDKTSLLDGLTPGTPVTVGCNVRGNEYKGKFYSSITGWKIDAGQAPVGAVSEYEPTEEEDDIPF